ncbi:MAG: adenine methyltransferase [Bacteroidia bacterium]|nr:adenine methyltransferase [Bacteroidia bacterium]
MASLYATYLQALAQLHQRGDATEESFYPALKEFLEKFAHQRQQKLEVTVLPKRTEAGSPDFRVWDGSGQVIGYIEAKAPGTNLTAIEHTPQLKRYLETFPNLILTDFYEFRLYREGKLLKQVILADAVIAQRVKEPPPARGAKGCDELLTQFLSYQLTIAPAPKELARNLAQRTRFLRDEAILPELSNPNSPSREITKLSKIISFLISTCKNSQTCMLRR